MPFIVGILGVYGTDPDSRRFDKGLPVTAFRKAQFAAVEQYDRKAPARYRGNVIAVDSGPYYELELSDIYWKRRVKQGQMTPEKMKEECARYGFGDGELTAEEQRTWDRCSSNAEYHYLGSGKTFVRFGKALAEAMLTVTPRLAPTPPMGWNSWNCFEKEIDEKKIRAIADAMVRSGMREAGYVYLVLDDAWMAKNRDENGRLQADPQKFPSGMKAIGDYIHAKGLKYGIYQDRGKMTCQQLPGSFGHEKIDMETFAEWGVDYIKLDSCFAESNGRMSSEDYAIYRKQIEATGRPIVLSISDFGNAAWAWGGKESAQLWRTSGDIYPWMGSVYHCAGTSSHERAIHPAFNGLWQFAGPGHWNDPDMLQVGNLKNIPDDRPIQSASPSRSDSRSCS